MKWLDKYQEGGETIRYTDSSGKVRLINTNSDEYKQLYNSGKLVGISKGSDTVTARPLDEVVVTGQAPEKGFWEQSVRSYLDENKDAGFLGALGSVAMYPLGLPQQAMMYGLTGKVQRPSTAMGITNPVGSFLTDAIADPTNLVGAGLADDAFKLTSRLGKLKPRGYKQIDAPVNSATPQPSFSTPYIPKTASELENTGYLKDKFYHKDLFETKKAQALERLSTPAGEQRLQQFIDDNYKLNPDNFGNQVTNPFSLIMNGFKNSKKFTTDQFRNHIKEMEFETPKKYVETGRDKRGKPVYELVADNNYQTNAYHWYRDGINKPSKMTIGEGNTPYDALHLFEHEFGHLMQRDEISNIDNLLSNVTLKEQKTPTVNSFKSSESIIEPGYSTTKNDPAMTSFQGNLDYFKTGSFGKEKYPFAAELRENMLQRGLIKSYDDTITPELVQQHADLYNKTGGSKYVLRLYDLMDGNPENFKTISSALNKMPALVPAGVATATVASQLPEKKQGGVITDPRGQWAHPGKITRIPSSEITMRGVPYNVLGISDTGDTQMMYPGKDYSYNGSSVTEYPIGFTNNVVHAPELKGYFRRKNG